jgi:hypothetical protein
MIDLMEIRGEELCVHIRKQIARSHNYIIISGSLAIRFF